MWVSVLDFFSSFSFFPGAVRWEVCELAMRMVVIMLAGGEFVLKVLRYCGLKRVIG